MSELAPHGDWVTAGKLRPLLAPRGRATQRKIARVSVGDAHTKAVPLDAGLRSRRGNVIAPATPARERHDAPAPRVEAVRPPHVTSSARQAPPPEAAPQGEKHKPDAAPPQGGKAHAPKNEHGREKAE